MAFNDSGAWHAFVPRHECRTLPTMLESCGVGVIIGGTTRGIVGIWMLTAAAAAAAADTQLSASYCQPPALRADGSSFSLYHLT